MKKTERILGIIGLCLLVGGTLFKFLHWPSAAIQMVFAVLIFNFGYLSLNLFNNWRLAESALGRIYAILKFLTVFTLLGGFILKTMHWPGPGIALEAIKYLLPSYILLYFALRILNKGKIPFSFDDLVMAIIAAVILVTLFKSMISNDIMNGYNGLTEEYEKQNTGIISSNTLIYESVDSLLSVKDEELLQSINDLRVLSEEYREFADSMRRDFYRLLLDLPGLDRTDHISLTPYGAVIVKDGQQFFFDQGNASLARSQLKIYNEGIEDITQRHHIQSGQIGMGLSTDNFINRYGYEITWENEMFGQIPAGVILMKMAWIKQMVLLSESYLLNSLISQLDLSEETRLLQELASQESDKAMQLKENEIVRVKQQQELQTIQLEKSQDEIKQNRMMAIFAFAGVALVLVLLSISTRAYVRKQKDNKKLAAQKEKISEANEALNQQNEEIAAQRDEIETQRDLVFQQKEQIEKTHEEISSSIDYATRLQAAILPNPGLLKEKFQDHFVFFRPKDKVSGDFFWWTEVEQRIIVTAADCTGHGVPGAFMSMLGVSLLREIVNKEFITQPGVILRRLRKEVIRSLDQKGEYGEQKDGMDMALISLDLENKTCEFAGANNPLYLIRKGELTEYRADRMPVSYYQKMDTFTTHEIGLEKGDQLYMFSDGYYDQFGGEQRKKFKSRAFKQLLTDFTDAAMEKQHDILLDTIVKWQGGYEQIDDMVIVGIKI